MLCAAMPHSLQDGQAAKAGGREGELKVLLAAAAGGAGMRVGGSRQSLTPCEPLGSWRLPVRQS